MNKHHPYYSYPYYGYSHPGYPHPGNQNTGYPTAAQPANGSASGSQPQQAETQSNYKNENSKTHFAMGIAAGAAIAYLLTNKKFQQGVTATGEKAWTAVRGEVEELKERLEDTQAELEYYRNLHKGEE